jgi:hypothetical protein
VLRGIRVLAWIRGVKPSRARLEQHRRWSPASSDDPSEMVGGAGSQDRLVESRSDTPPACGRCRGAAVCPTSAARDQGSRVDQGRQAELRSS